jgi:hypothetical protein
MDTTDACDTFGTAPNSHGACTQTYCGDGTIQQLGNGDPTDNVSLESCDPNNPGWDDVTCNPLTCAPTYCGDGLVQGPGGTWTSQGVAAAGDTTSPGAGIGPDEHNGSNEDGIALVDAIIDDIIGPDPRNPIIVGTGAEQCDDANAEQFDYCTSVCLETKCHINGYLYLDINDDNLKNIGDQMIPSYSISLSNGSTTTTNAQGYYAFTGLDCTQSYTVTYQDHPMYHEDSDQKDGKVQDVSTPSVTGIVVTPSEFREQIS